MRWFKHDCDMHTDLKIQNLIEKHGAEGYAFFNLCLEMLGKEGKNGRIDGRSRWRQLLSKVFGWSDNDKANDILNTMAELNLIDSKALKYDNLYIPKFIKKADDYTMRKVRMLSEHNTNNVHVEQIRIDKNRIEQILNEFFKLKNYDLENDKPLLNALYKRYVKSAKELCLVARNDNEAIEAMQWLSATFARKNLAWTLETVIRWFPEYLKTGRKSDELKKLEESINAARNEERNRIVT